MPSKDQAKRARESKEGQEGQTKRTRTEEPKMNLPKTCDKFPIAAFPGEYKKISIDPWKVEKLTPELTADLKANINLCRDAIVAFSATGAASGYGGHTGGAYDVVPEIAILDAFFRACPDKFVPIFFDEAGHRVAAQYMLATLKGALPAADLCDYRRGNYKLPGHPEIGMTPGIEFSSGRLGHMWPFCNGVAMAHPGKIVVMLGSDGSQQEGNDAEAARLAVAKDLNVKVFIDDNDVTITGNPSEYLPGFDCLKTLQGQNLRAVVADAENLSDLFDKIRNTVITTGPGAVVARRKMAPGIEGLEGTFHGHDAVPVAKAKVYLEARGHKEAAAMLDTVKKGVCPQSSYMGCGPMDSMRQKVGDVLCSILGGMSKDDRVANVMAIDSDLGSSTGLQKIQKAYPEVYCHSGIMERGNFSAAAGFGMTKGKQGIFSTFGAFLEMIISEITMARLNKANVLCHFSHCGVDDMADNTCHFGVNQLFADNGLEEIDHHTSLFFPSDTNQVDNLLRTVFPMPGLRFVFTTRSKTATILKEDGTPFFASPYKFQVGKDDLIREGKQGYIMSFGDALYRCLDAVEALKKEGIDVGLVCKTTLNVVDEEMIQKVGKAPFLLIVEPLNVKTGLGSKFGTYLLKRGLHPKFDVIGTHKEGEGGLWEHAYTQGYDSTSVQKAVKKML
ncbi:putative transketolase C-terminal section [Diplonema papillatum]|nr:putative transketolase C-terminal section [Diplonema papillatum]